MKKNKLLKILFLLVLALSLPAVQNSPVSTAKAWAVADGSSNGGDGPTDGGGQKPSGGSQGTGSMIDKLIRSISDWLTSGGEGSSINPKSA